MTATPVWVQLVYLAAAVLFILALKGLSSPKHARTGNLMGAIGAVVAVAVVFFYAELDHVVPILVAIAIGSVVGVVGAQRVQMTQMPQLVALFNGVINCGLNGAVFLLVITCSLRVCRVLFTFGAGGAG